MEQSSCAPVCEKMDAQQIPTCVNDVGTHGWTWSGRICVRILNGISHPGECCTGSDCGGLFPTLAACEAEHDVCIP